MRIVYEAKRYPTSQDFPTAAEAIACIEERGEGSVVKFVVEPNLPGCLPAEVHRSCALWSFDGKKWWGHAIFGGSGKWEERPE